MLSLEHSGRPANSNDGCCLTLLISVKVGSRISMKLKPTLQCPPISQIPPMPSKILFQVPLESVCLIDKYSWLETERTLGDQLIARLGKNMTVPLAVIRWSTTAFTTHIILSVQDLSISWRRDIAKTRFSMFFAVLCNMSISVPILVWFKLVFISIFLEVAKKDWCHIVPEKDSARSGTECHQELKLAHLSLNCFEMLFAHLE